MKPRYIILLWSAVVTFWSGCASTQDEFTSIPAHTLGRGSPGADFYYPDETRPR
jgi:hypothetical protein